MVPPTTAPLAPSPANYLTYGDPRMCVKRCEARTGLPAADLVYCALQGCGNSIHRQCCNLKVIQKNGLDPLLNPHGKELVVCSKKCHAKVASHEVATKVPWDRDGPTPEVNSEKVIIEWLMVPGNYQRYCEDGHKRGGIQKIQFAEMLQRRIQEAGITTERTPRAICYKIAYIENSFRDAHDYSGREEKRGGLRETDPTGYRDACIKMYKHYFDLLEVMGCRAAARPQVTSEDLSSDDDEARQGRVADSAGDGDDAEQQEQHPRQPAATQPNTATVTPRLRTPLLTRTDGRNRANRPTPDSGGNTTTGTTKRRRTSRTANNERSAVATNIETRRHNEAIEERARREIDEVGRRDEAAIERQREQADDKRKRELEDFRFRMEL